jgi:hypothetical protein
MVDEMVIRGPVGAPSVQRVQLRHLLALGERSNVVLLVVPFTASAVDKLTPCEERPTMIAPEFAQAAWRKSTYSSDQANCVEASFADWHKSSRSTGEANCVEVAVRASRRRRPRHQGSQRRHPCLPSRRLARIPHRPKCDAPRVAVRSLRPGTQLLCGCDAALERSLTPTEIPVTESNNQPTQMRIEQTFDY